jgi:hypothetical protein
MSFNKPTKVEANDDDEYKKLMCSFPGCKNRWSVRIDAPMCSFHQWGSHPPRPKEIELKPKTPQWYDSEKF